MPGAKARLRLDGADPINRGLLARLPLKEQAGARLLDMTGRQRSPVIIGTPVRRFAPIIGPVTNFPAASQYGLVSSTKIVSGLPNWSIGTWLRTANGFTTVTGAALYCERAAVGLDIVKLNGLSTGLGGNFSTSAFITIRDDGGTLIQGCVGSTAINDGKAHWIVATKAGSALSLYIDGKLENTATWTGTDTFTDAIDSRIAGDPAALSDVALGDYACVVLYNRALRPIEVSRLYRDPWAGTARPVRTAAAALAPITGTLAVTLAAATLSSTGSLSIVGQAAITTADATLSSTGTLSIVGQAAITLADATLSATGLNGNPAIPSVGAASRTTRGARRIYLPPPEPPIILPATLAKTLPNAVYDDDEDAWILLG